MAEKIKQNIESEYIIPETAEKHLDDAEIEKAQDDWSEYQYMPEDVVKKNEVSKETAEKVHERFQRLMARRAMKLSPLLK